jgi:hypothetical protein
MMAKEVVAVKDPAIVEFLKALPDTYIKSEHNRRLGKARSEPVSCPICGERQPSRLALRKHFHRCKARHPESKETLTGVIGEERQLDSHWAIVRCFDGSDLAGRQWVEEQPPRQRRFRRVQRGSKLWLRAVEAEKQLNRILADRVRRLEKEMNNDTASVR